MSEAGLLADWQIRELALKHGMISPFAEVPREPGVISFGLDSYGYDIRLYPEIWVFTDVITGGGDPVDPKVFQERLYVSQELSGPFPVPPRGFVMGRSVESFRIPRDILVLPFGKSTYTRCGLAVHITPLNPEWGGIMMLAIANGSPHPVRIYHNEGIAKLIFVRAAQLCSASYVERGGKYQGQEEIVGPRV